MISVIVPVYKTEQYLKKCIDSILNQTYRDFELLLVDDGTPDRGGEICDGYALKDQRIKVIHKQNGGLSDARNKGIDAAQGEYITFIDSDDWIDPSLLEVLYKGIEKGAQISVCGFYTVRNGLPKPWREVSEEQVVMTASEATRDMMYTKSMDISAWGKLFHKSCFQEIRFPVGCLYEDVATTYRLFMTQEKVVVTTKPLYYYVKHFGSITTSSFDLRHMDMMRFSRDMLAFAEEQESALIPAAKRRIIYACCFLLKTMGKHYRSFPEEVREIRTQYKIYHKDVFFDPEASRRDKAAIMMLKMGVGFFIMAWSFYSSLTGRHGNA